MSIRRFGDLQYEIITILRTFDTATRLFSKPGYIIYSFSIIDQNFQQACGQTFKLFFSIDHGLRTVQPAGIEFFRIHTCFLYQGAVQK